MKRKLQVFVSSTFTDLIEERQAAVSAILKSGHIPAGMELFTAGDKSQMNTIEQWIDESDVNMLILGGRYGSIEPISGVSYTELEYDYASGTGMPMFATVITEAALDAKVKASGPSFIETDNAKQLKQFREKVLRNVSSFFDDGKDVKLCVFESISDHALNPNLKGWISAAELPDFEQMKNQVLLQKAENDELLQKINKLESSVSSGRKIEHGSSSDELFQILKQTEIKVPANIAGKKEETISNLLNVLVWSQDSLVSGVDNSSRSGAREIFLYYNVVPKLSIHGLAENEKVAGVQWRRSFLNSTGRDFLAYIARRKMDKNKSKSSRVETSENGDESTTTTSPLVPHNHPPVP